MLLMKLKNSFNKKKIIIWKLNKIQFKKSKMIMIYNKLVMKKKSMKNKKKMKITVNSNYKFNKYKINNKRIF